MEERDADLSDKPLYGKRRKRLIRAFVFITVGAMLLPALASLYSVSASAAQRTCVIAVIHEAPDATGYSAPFQMFGPGIVGWECYATGTFGGDRHIASFGIFPGFYSLPQQGGVQT